MKGSLSKISPLCNKIAWVSVCVLEQGRILLISRALMQLQHLYNVQSLTFHPNQQMTITGTESNFSARFKTKESLGPSVKSWVWQLTWRYMTTSTQLEESKAIYGKSWRAKYSALWCSKSSSMTVGKSRLKTRLVNNLRFGIKPMIFQMNNLVKNA